jgi:SOS-response transcriptional repressor LexA
MPRRETKERVLEFVRRRLLGGLPPTVREVQAALGFQSSATAREHLERLVAEGRLTRAPSVLWPFALVLFPFQEGTYATP